MRKTKYMLHRTLCYAQIQLERHPFIKDADSLLIYFFSSATSVLFQIKWKYTSLNIAFLNTERVVWSKKKIVKHTIQRTKISTISHVFLKYCTFNVLLNIVIQLRRDNSEQQIMLIVQKSYQQQKLCFVSIKA